MKVWTITFRLFDLKSKHLQASLCEGSVFPAWVWSSPPVMCPWWSAGLPVGSLWYTWRSVVEAPHQKTRCQALPRPYRWDTWGPSHSSRRANKTQNVKLLSTSDFFFPTKCFKLIRVWHKYTRFQWKYNLKNPLKKERNNCLFANSLNELWEFKSSPVQVWGKNIFLVDSRCLFFLLDRKNTNAFDSSETCSPNKQNPCYRGTEESINPHSWREVWVLQQRRLWTSERNKHYTYPNHVLNSCSTSQSGHWFIILPT